MARRKSRLIDSEIDRLFRVAKKHGYGMASAKFTNDGVELLFGGAENFQDEPDDEWDEVMPDTRKGSK